MAWNLVHTGNGGGLRYSNSVKVFNGNIIYPDYVSGEDHSFSVFSYSSGAFTLFDSNDIETISGYSYLYWRVECSNSSGLYILARWRKNTNWNDNIFKVYQSNGNAHNLTEIFTINIVSEEEETLNYSGIGVGCSETEIIINLSGYTDINGTYLGFPLIYSGFESFTENTYELISGITNPVLTSDKNYNLSIVYDESNNFYIRCMNDISHDPAIVYKKDNGTTNWYIHYTDSTYLDRNLGILSPNSISCYSIYAGYRIDNTTLAVVSTSGSTRTRVDTVGDTSGTVIATLNYNNVILEFFQVYYEGVGNSEIWYYNTETRTYTFFEKIPNDSDTVGDIFYIGDYIYITIGYKLYVNTVKFSDLPDFDAKHYKMLSMSIPITSNTMVLCTEFSNGNLILSNKNSVVWGNQIILGTCKLSDVGVTYCAYVLALDTATYYVYGRFTHPELGLCHIIKTEDSGVTWEVIVNDWGSAVCAALLFDRQTYMLYAIRESSSTHILYKGNTKLVSKCIIPMGDNKIDHGNFVMDSKKNLYIASYTQNEIAVMKSLAPGYTEWVDITFNHDVNGINRILVTL